MLTIQRANKCAGTEDSKSAKCFATKFVTMPAASIYTCGGLVVRFSNRSRETRRLVAEKADVHEALKNHNKMGRNEEEADTE